MSKENAREISQQGPEVASKDDMRLRVFAHKSGAFNSRKSAFDYFFFIEGRSIEEAERLAGIVASARSLPEQPEPPENFADKAKRVIGQCSQLMNENPRISDFVIGLLSGAVTSLAGVSIGAKANAGNESSAAPAHDIDTDSEPKEIE